MDAVSATIQHKKANGIELYVCLTGYCPACSDSKNAIIKSVVDEEARRGMGREKENTGNIMSTSMHSGCVMDISLTIYMQQQHPASTSYYCQW